MTTTTNVKYSTPAHGSNVNTWDADPVNNNSLISDAIFGSVTSTALSNVPVTLSATALQVSVLRFSGALSGNVAVTISAIRKSWFVENLCTGAFVVTLTGGSGNIIALPPGSCQVYWDGTNMSFINLGRVGQYWDYAGAGVPAWVAACTVPPALHCNGGAFSAVTYPLLNAILGTTTLPDSRGRTRFALDAGTSRLNTNGGIDGTTRFAGGGTGTGLGIGQNNLPNVNFNLSINDTRTWGLHYALVGSGGGVSAVVGATAGGLVFPVSVDSGGVGGTAASGGSGTLLATVSPGFVHGITLIWSL